MIRVDLVQDVVEDEPVDGWPVYKSRGTATMTISGSCSEIAALAPGVWDLLHDKGTEPAQADDGLTPGS